MTYLTPPEAGLDPAPLGVAPLDVAPLDVAPLGVAPLDVEDLRARVQQTLAEFLGQQARLVDTVSDELVPLLRAGADFVLDGGKRLRPAFAYWGWRGAGGDDCEPIVRAAASLELLQACALVHDDVMDDSDTRRGQPAVHRRFEALHRSGRWHGSAQRFGAAAAVLLGDLYLIWADQLLHACGLESLPRALPVYDEMRVELMAGQYLDVVGQAHGAQSTRHSLLVARFKSAKYTIERPLHLGAALAGAPAPLIAAYSGYGLPLGEAFQLRDDVLGVFGDPARTGKPAGDDLREGKRTVLVALAHQRAQGQARAVIDNLLGDAELDPAGVTRLREVIVETGALATVETMISERVDKALAALDRADVDEPARHVLAALAAAATRRQG